MIDTSAKEVLAETVHTAFRKGCDHGGVVHEAITRLPSEEWSNALDWMLWCFDEVGYELRKKDQRVDEVITINAMGSGNGTGN